MALCGIELGLGTGRFPELELTHLIPARKLTLKYVEDLYEGFGYAGTVLNALYDRPEHFPGQIQSGALRIFLLSILMFASGKSRAERRIRLAREKGGLRAQRELKRWAVSGVSQPPRPVLFRLEFQRRRRHHKGQPLNETIAHVSPFSPACWWPRNFRPTCRAAEAAAR